MKEKQNKPFEIQVAEQVDDTYSVTAKSLGGSWFGTIPSNLPLLTEQEIQQAGDWLKRGFIDREYAKDIGSRMFETLFTGRIREGFREAYGKIDPEKEGLRVILTLPQALTDLPWELIYDRDGEHSFLARSSSTPLVRSFIGTPIPNPLPEKGPLRVLIITASPHNLPTVSTEQEIIAITESLSIQKLSLMESIIRAGHHFLRDQSLYNFYRRLRYRSLVEITLLSHATRQDLQHYLLEARNSNQNYHVLHFIGHGQADEYDSQLIFEDADGEADAVPADEFAELLSGSKVNLTFLNACETAATSNLFQSTAQKVLKRRVSAAIGMQVPFLDRKAVEFAREFYFYWAIGEPLENALADARRLISKDNRGAAADWAIPVLYMGSVEGPTPQIEAPPCSWPWPVRMTKWSIGAFFALLSTVGLLLGLSLDVPAARERGGILYPFWPAPTATLVPTPTPTPLPPMPSTGFNVAVAEFAEFDAAGNLVSSEVGRELSEWLVYAIGLEIKNVDPMFRKTVWGPEKVTYIPGNSPVTRAENAAQFAAEYQVTVLIYGVVTAGDVGYRVSPEFYVSKQGFGYGSEVAGPDRLGQPVPFTTPLEPGERRDINIELNARTTALEHLVKGLVHFYAGSYGSAWEEFKSADEDGQPEEGEEVIYLLMGAAKLEQYQKAKEEERDPWQLARATDAFAQAYALNDDYARSYLGLGGVALLQATPNLNECDIDEEKLAEAGAWYSASLNASDQPVSANVPIKAAYGLAQAHLVGYQCRIPGWSDEQSRDYLKQVIAIYEDERPPDLIWFAGQAHALLGRLANLESNWPVMRVECEDAIKLLEDVPGKPPTDAIAQYWRWLAFAEEMLGNLDDARDSFRKAILTGTGTVDRKVLDDWQAELDRLEKGAP